MAFICMFGAFASSLALISACLIMLTVKAVGETRQSTNRCTAIPSIGVVAAEAVKVIRNDRENKNEVLQARSDAVSSELHWISAGERNQRTVATRMAATDIPHSPNGTTLEIDSKDDAVGARLSQALDEERDKADALARELDAARMSCYLEAVQTAEEEIRQREGYERLRERADRLARELKQARSEIDAARLARQNPDVRSPAPGKEDATFSQASKLKGANSEQLARDALLVERDAARAEIAKLSKAMSVETEQKQKLAAELRQQRDGAAVAVREQVQLREELKASQTATSNSAQQAANSAQQAANAANQQLAALERERDSLRRERERSETLARDLASMTRQFDDQSARLAGMQAEALRLSEASKAMSVDQKRDGASEKDRADVATRELALVRNELETANRRITFLNVFLAFQASDASTDRTPSRATEVSVKAEENERMSAPIPSAGATADQGHALTLQSPAPAIPPDTPSALDLKTIDVEQPAAVDAALRQAVEERKLLARATVLLKQADIGAARPVLEHALQRGSAQAAFMLAETYDDRVLQSWRARGVSGDAAKARGLYEQAKAGGIENARQRIETLK